MSPLTPVERARRVLLVSLVVVVVGMALTVAGAWALGGWAVGALVAGAELIGLGALARWP